MEMELKDFQKRTLAKLKAYLERARLYDDPEQAFVAVAETQDGHLPVYNKIPGLEKVPYVCLRLPTGGGKTIVGAHAIHTAGQSYIEKDYPVVLWLVPTNTIRTQTAVALKNPAHPYRIALDEAFEGRVRVFDISEIEDIRPQDMRDGVCLIVGTIQTLRVEKTESRDVYAHKEALEDHFTRINSNLPGLEKIEDGPNAGKTKYSFANLMAIHQPMVIMDEAHNARTSLTFDALKRVSPSCIVELTATPDTSRRTGSNVLHRVSAAELKAEDMIKLPIVLTIHQEGWERAIGDALRTRKRLLELAAGEPEFVRPILLIQAESKDKPANVEAVKKYLIENEHVREVQIAIATGEQRGLDKINLFDRACPIDVVITVQALKEGWDCSFAYVFCSTANIGSSKDVEQLLGRVLRMPYAKKRKAPELNKAYAHVSSPNFLEAAHQLESCMIAMGFEDVEAKDNIEITQPSFPNLPLNLVMNPLRLTVEQAPNLEGLSELERQSVMVTDATPGSVQVEAHGEITHAVRERLLAAASETARPAVERAITEYATTQRMVESPAERGQPFKVPRLCVHYQGELELFDRELILDAAGWNLIACPASLEDFRFDDTSKTFEFDVDGNRVKFQFKGEQQLDLNLLATEWTATELVRWLDKQLRQPDITQERLLEWLRRGIDQLLAAKRFDLATLVRAKFILMRKLEGQIKQCRTEAYAKGYQELLFGPNAAVETSYTYGFDYDPNNYPASWFYEGRFELGKHFYARVGELESKGEEFDCAFALSTQSSVRHWVRNLSGWPLASMWLQTSTDRFYPDFVAELLDGRILMVEYKGKAYVTNDDSKEKRQLGEKWEAASNGKALFLMAEKQDHFGRGVYEQIRAKIEGQT